jgi:serine/threonine protein kinase
MNLLTDLVPATIGLSVLVVIIVSVTLVSIYYQKYLRRKFFTTLTASTSTSSITQLSSTFETEKTTVSRTFTTTTDSTTMTATTNVNQAELSIPGFLEVSHPNDAYRKGRIIGRGGDGMVYLAETMSRQLMERAGSRNVVVKELQSHSPLSQEMLAFRQEISILWLLRESPFTCKIVGYTQNPNTIIMRYYEHGPVDRLIYSTSLIEKSTLFTLISGIARGLETIHRYSIAHLDIKPGNILLDMRDGQLYPVITDFGISVVTSNDILLVRQFKSVVRIAHTVMYCSPEIFTRTSPRAMLPLADIYSYAVVMLAMLTRKSPW